MASKQPAKPILKQQAPTQKPTVSDEQQARVDRDRRNLGIALYHANKIQGQKNIQAQILSHIEQLIEFPAADAFTANEASTFVSLIHPFQPSDFDSLVEERTVNEKCGYALCSQTPRSTSMGASAAWKLSAPGAGNYCSNLCQRKALYVKTQLSEVPAWEREAGQQPAIILPEDDRPSTDALGSHANGKLQQRLADGRELALERGETAASFKPNQVMTDIIVEKPTVSYRPIDISYMSAAIEGHVPLKDLPEFAQPDPGTGTDHNHAQASSHVAGGVLDDGEDESWRDLFKNVPNG